MILRAYRRYRRVVAPTFTAAYQNDVLCAHPKTASMLVELFRARFCEDSDEREAALRARLDEQLAAVGSLDEDRILRGFAALIDATMRTNAALGRDYLSFKLRSADVPQMPAPAPLFEIFVYHPPSRASTCAAGTSRAEASAGPTVARTIAPRCWA